MGYTEEQFWHSNPRKDKYYFEAYRLKRKCDDEIAHRQGFYTYMAVATALSNAFRKKGDKPSEYMKEPITAMSEEECITEKQKINATNSFFNHLKLMQANFELSKKSEE